MVACKMDSYTESLIIGFTKERLLLSKHPVCNSVFWKSCGINCTALAKGIKYPRFIVFSLAKAVTKSKGKLIKLLRKLILFFNKAILSFIFR